MQKVFVLKPSDGMSVVNFQSLLNEGYEVKHITASHVAIAGKGDSYTSDSTEGRIVYILEKPKQE